MEGTQSEKVRNISRDGAKIADMEYYNLLDVAGDVTDLDLKKAYRKAAIKNHPDKGGDEEKFKMIGEAYRVLSDNNLRADYDRHGKKKPTDEVGLKEATEMFGNLFGGERFVDLIGEISLLKDFGKASEIMMTDEERAELEKSMQDDSHRAPEDLSSGAASDANIAGAASTEKPATSTNTVGSDMRSNGQANFPSPGPNPSGKAAASTATDSTPVAGTTTTNASASSQHLSTQDSTGTTPTTGAKAPPRTKPKLTPEQRQKLELLEKEKREAEEKRITDLTAKLKDRIRPFVEARNPGDKDDSETQLFGRRMREEAEDLKLESFGVELLHTIGNIYLSKSTTWVKSQRHNLLGLPGFFSRLKEKGSQVKETWGLMGSAMSVLVSMEDIQRRQEKGDVDEEEMRQLEQDMSSKMLLATWRGTRSEVNSVLRKVCDNVLYEKGVDQKNSFASSKSSRIPWSNLQAGTARRGRRRKERVRASRC